MPKKKDDRMKNQSIRLDDDTKARLAAVAALMGERAGLGEPIAESDVMRAALRRGLAEIEEELRKRK